MKGFARFSFCFQALWALCVKWLAMIGGFFSYLSSLFRGMDGSREGDCERARENLRGQMLDLMVAALEQQTADAHAAALDGSGPMPFDRSWFEVETDFQSLIDREDGMQWHLANDLLEVLDWALASPQGQRALARQGDPLNPGADALNALFQFQDALTEKVRIELLKHARELKYPDALMAVLQEHLYT
jgi:hypothetical protein